MGENFALYELMLYFSKALSFVQNKLKKQKWGEMYTNEVN